MAIMMHDILCWFAPSDPTPEQFATLAEIREQTRALATRLLALTPQGMEQDVAIGKLREVLMWANAAAMSV